ncbi:MAG TPA: Rnf-Nqr domain containing protein [Alkalispirochaeta sp.]|nr:Rnf-Nqr domain containing protein [Alkalispirochaeta sp.]
MTHFSRHMTTRNPVWMIPLALPFVLYAGQAYDLALLFSVTVAITVPTIHGISFFVERWLPRHLRAISVLVIGAVVVTIVEMVLVRMDQAPSDRTRYMVQALAVAGITVWPTFSSPAGESFRHRMAVAGGLAVGFVVGFVPLAAIRIALSRSGYHYADSVAVGFLLLAVGRMLISTYRRYGSAATPHGNTPQDTAPRGDHP